MSGKAPPAILLVEDERIVAKELQLTLNEMGYDVFAIADSAEEAVACASKKCPDLVLMDIRIKGRMDGIETAAILKEKFNCTLIYLTAYADEATIERAKKTEPYGYLLKPVKSAELRSMIEIALYKQQLDRAREREAHLESILARRAGELSESNARLKALTDLNLQLASERDPRVLLEKVCDSARVLIGAVYGVLVAKEKTDAESIFFTTSGIHSAESAAPLPTPQLEFGVLGRVYAEGKAWRIRYDGRDAPMRVLPAEYPVAHSYLAVPVSSLTRTYGWLCLADKIGADEFAAEDERILVSLAGQAGRIYENGSLYQQVQIHAANLQFEMDRRERSAAELRQSEERFRQLAETIQDVFFVMSADYSELSYLSPAYEQIWGRPHLPANPMDWADSIHPDDRRRVLDQLKNYVANPTSDAIEFRIVQPSGAIRWILARLFVLYDNNDQPYRIIGVATDITEHKQAEAKIQHLNRVYAVLSGINTLIVRVQTQAELFTEACRIAVEQGGFQLAWIGWLKKGEEGITPVAWAGEPVIAQMLRDVGVIALEADAFQSAAFHGQQTRICNDLEAEARPMLYRKEMVACGIRSVVTLPLAIRDRTMGCLVLATNERGSFDAAEMRLLIELAGDITFALDHMEKADKLNYLAYYDSLTGLANRTLFLERLSQNVTLEKYNHAQFALVIVDPERFETINETFGRTQGDVLLKEISNRLTDCIGDTHAVARVGPGQFAAVIPFMGDVEVAARALDEQYQVWFGMPFKINGNQLTLTARAGISLFPHDATDAESLLKNAEAALKRAAATGERSVFFTQEISDRIAERLSMETRLRRALANEEFVLHYQPKVDLETREITGLEALIRWNSPELGLVPPAKFIPLMEETGMIIEVGAWVLRQACVDRVTWLEQELDAPRIAVNVSTVQLRQTDFVSVVRSALKLATRNALLFGGPRAGIDIEVTESLLVENAEANMEKLSAIRDLGVGIAIDDFGTGYSSLGYLAKMPIDCLKIDRTFTGAMLEEPSVMTLVSTMITLAHALNLDVVAEGVESEEQAKILRLLRCDQMQGYLTGKPVPRDQITALLTRPVK
jgi:diguanylate cyclase